MHTIWSGNPKAFHFYCGVTHYQTMLTNMPKAKIKPKVVVQAHSSTLVVLMVRIYIGIGLALEPLQHLVNECKVGSLRTTVITTKPTLVLLGSIVATTLKWRARRQDILDVPFIHHMQLLPSWKLY